MCPSAIDSRVADEMVDVLFRDSTQFYFDNVLIVGRDRKQIDAALDRHFTDSVDDRPNVYTPRGGNTAAPSGEVDSEVIDGAFLSEGFSPSVRFDYVLGVPPVLPWSKLDAERQREIAGFSPHIEPADTDAHATVAYLDRVGPLLTEQGRAVVLGRPGQTVGLEYTGFSGEIIQHVRDVESVEPRGDYVTRPWVILAIDRDDDRFDVDERAQWADPFQIEALLSQAVNQSRTQRTASALATPLAEMTVYGQNDDASSVYLDMLYRDFDGSLVYEEPDSTDGLIGYISRQELTFDGTPPIAEHVQSLTSQQCLPKTATVRECISVLAENRFQFVGDPGAPVGIVTRYDLNRLPIYHWLFDRFAQLEIQLRSLIRDSEWTPTETDVSLYQHTPSELVPDVLANESLGTIVRIVEEMELEAELLPSYDQFDPSLRDLVDLRNAVAHYNVIVHTMSDRETLDDDERGAGQLWQEVKLLVAASDTESTHRTGQSRPS